MSQRKLTIADLCEVTGYTRDQLKALLREIPGWSPARGARVAREFSPHDLIVVATIHALDVGIGMRRKQIAVLVPKLRHVLVGPRAVDRSASISISFDPPTIDYFVPKSAPRQGVIVDVGAIYERVDRYLSPLLPWSRLQEKLPLGPTLVKSSAKRRRASGGR